MGDPAGRELLEVLVRQMCRDTTLLDVLVHKARENSAAIAALPEDDVRHRIAILMKSLADACTEFKDPGYAARIQALRGLLHGDRGAAAADAGLDERTRYHCLIADVTDPRLAPRVEAVLASAGGTAGFVDGNLCCVAPRLPSLVKLAEVTVVASPAQLPRELAGTYRICRAALASALLRGLSGLHHVTDLATLIAVDAHPQLGVALAGTFLGGLDAAKDFHRLLAKTALAYLDHGCNADVTGAALHVHPNTVKHRLRRFAELTAFSAASGQGESVTDAMRWWWALDAWLRLTAS